MGEVGVNFLIAAAVQAINSKLDTTIFYGTGADGEPTGLSENEDVQEIAAGEFDLLTGASMVKTCELSNGNVIDFAFAGSPSIRETLSLRPVIIDSDRFVLENDKVLNRPFFSSNNISGGDLWGGNYSTVLLLSFFGGIEISINPFLEDKEGII